VTDARCRSRLLQQHGRLAILAYGWALVVPFGVGLGMYMQALRDRDQHALRTGRTLIFIA